MQPEKKLEEKIRTIKTKLQTENLSTELENQLKIELQKLSSEYQNLNDSAEIKFEETRKIPYAVFDSEDAQKYLD